MDTICLDCRGDKVFIPKGELEMLNYESWYLPNMILAEMNDGSQSQKSHIKIYPIWEDKMTVMSIIESIRHHRLIILENVNIDYLIVLVDKWCCPQWLIDSLESEKKERKLMIDINDKHDTMFRIFTNIIQCRNCRTGYKISDNTPTSCKFHYGVYSAYNDRWDCCGAHSGFVRCSEGYHVPNIPLENIMNILMMNIPLNDDRINTMVQNINSNLNIQQNFENQEPIDENHEEID